MREFTDEGFSRVMDTITRLRRRNKDLATRLVQVEQSRDHWRRLALERSRVISNQRRALERWKARTPEWRRPPRRKRPSTVQEILTHQRIVDRIRSIPPREI